MAISKPVWRVIALTVATLFFWLALRSDVDNATAPPSVARALFGAGVLHFAHPWWLSLHIALRKAYSVVAFALVGYTAHRALRPTRRPALRAMLLVAAYSLGIEIAQRFEFPGEPNLESAFDVGCGALGGWLAIRFDQAWPILRGRPSVHVSRTISSPLAPTANQETERVS
jgi:hypothetical protein